MFTEPLRSNERRDIVYFTALLPSNDRRVTHTDTESDGGWRFFKHAVEIG
jgi:hypothetical protein